MNTFYVSLDWDQSLRIDQEAAYTSPSPKLELTYNLACETSYAILKLDGRLDRRIDLPPMDAVIRLEVERQELGRDYCREAIQNALREWPVSEDLLDIFIETAMRKAGDTLESSREDGHNSVHVDYSIRVEHVSVDDDGDGLEDVYVRVAYDDDGYLMEEGYDYQEVYSYNYMVPAVDSSVQGLETKTITDADATCSICLEAFDGGVGWCMPCSHVFHGYCIKKWLGTSHYCPMCRFVMPTS